MKCSSCQLESYRMKAETGKVVGSKRTRTIITLSRNNNTTEVLILSLGS